MADEEAGEAMLQAERRYSDAAEAETDDVADPGPPTPYQYINRFDDDDEDDDWDVA